MTHVKTLYIGRGSFTVQLECGHVQHVDGWHSIPRPGSSYDCPDCRAQEAQAGARGAVRAGGTGAAEVPSVAVGEDGVVNWMTVTRADPRANALAKRHYTCQSPDSGQYVPPGRCLCLYSTKRGEALWVTSWPMAEYVKHQWAGAWVCSIFRNEGHVLSSVLIRHAVAATRWYFSEPPTLGMVTFVDPRRVRAKEHMGRCFLEAGFEPCGQTKEEHLLAFQLLPERMPAAYPPLGASLRLWEAA